MTLRQRDRAADQAGERAPAAVPASLGQTMMWFVQEQFGGPGVLNVPILRRIGGPIDIRALAAALTAVVDRHEALRTTFAMVPEATDQEAADRKDDTSPGASLRYRVRPTGAGIDVDVADIRSADRPDDVLAERVAARLSETIDVTVWPPFTIDLFRTGDNEHVLLWNLSHLVTDAWSNEVLWRDLAVLYGRGTGSGPGAGLPAAPAAASDFIQAQALHLDGQEGAGHAQFWREHLAGAEYPLLRPPAERPADQYRRCWNEWFCLDASVNANLVAFAARHKVAPAIVLQAAFARVLHHLSGACRLAIGVVEDNRGDPAYHDTVGYLANVVTTRIEVPASPALADFVAAAGQEARRVAPHRIFPFLAVLMKPQMPAGAIRASEVLFQMPALPNGLGRRRHSATWPPSASRSRTE